MKIVFFLLVLQSVGVLGQKFKSNQSNITFYSKATLEDIKAENTQAVSLLDIGSWSIVFSVPISKFEFKESLMKEHFNEKYLESEKFPSATFKGTISSCSLTDSHEQAVLVKGKLTIHGVTQSVEVPGTLVVQGDAIRAKAKFIVVLQNYKVTIPKLLWKKIAEQVEVSVDFTYSKIK